MLRRPVRQTQKSGVFSYATVEDITLGYATIRLADGGKRMTRLPIMGGTIAIGDRVIVDWSAGVPPLVRPISKPLDEDTGLDDGVATGEVMNEIPSDVSFKVCGTVPSLVGHEFAAVVWDKTIWQTHEFYSSLHQDKIVIPFDGYYYIDSTIAVVGFADHRSIITNNHPDNDDYWDNMGQLARVSTLQMVIGELRHSEAGAFSSHQARAMDYEPSMFTTLQFGGMVYCTAGDEISLWLQQTDPDKENIDLIIDTEYNLYPVIWGFRMTQGGIASEYQYTPDDSTNESEIEIQENMGLLHVSDTLEGTYARGIAIVGDYGSLEITLDYTFQDVDYGAILRIWLKSSRDWVDWDIPTRGYEMSINNDGGWALHQVENGTRSILGGINLGPISMAQKLRFRADGTSIKARRWVAIEEEPATWDIEVTGTLTDWGGMQLGFFNQLGDHEVTLDNLDLHIP